MKGPVGAVGAAGSGIGTLVWRAAVAPAITSACYAWPTAGTPTTAEHKSAQVVAGAGTYTKLYVTSSIPLGSSNTLAVTLRKNGVDTGITLTLGAGVTSGNVTGSVSVVAGDILTLKVVQSGTGVATSWGFCAAVSP